MKVFAVYAQYQDERPLNEEEEEQKELEKASCAQL